MIRLYTPFKKNNITSLRAGENVLITGRIYTARDMAHKRLVEMIKNAQPLPIPLKDETLYYCGPTPTPPGRAIGSAGPTTSARMDPFTVPLLKLGVSGMIGKGRRSEEVRSAIKKFGAVYFAATGGTGALLSKRIKRSSVAAFRELGAEAIYELEVNDFPVIVAIDSRGRSIYAG